MAIMKAFEVREGLFQMRESGRILIKTIPISVIQFDEGYYRKVDKKHVKKLVEKFDEASMDDPRVNVRANGDIFCFSGRHRIEAAKILGLKEIQVIEHIGLTREREIENYKSADVMQKAHAKRDNYKAELSYNERYKTLNKIVEAEKFTICGNNGHVKLDAVKLFTDMLKDANFEKYLPSALEIVRQVWRGEKRKVIISGVYNFLKVAMGKQNFGIETMKKQLRKFQITPKFVIDTAKGLGQSVSAVLCDLYNKEVTDPKQRLNAIDFR